MARAKMNTQKARQLRADLRSVVREWGLMQSRPCIPELTLAQGHALIEIEHRSGITVRGLAQALHLDHSSASRLVSRLIERRWILKGASATDRRAKILALSPEGRGLLKRLHAESDRRVQGSLEVLSAEEQRTVVDGMRLYARALRQARGRSDVSLRAIRKGDNPGVAAVIRSVMPEFGADGPGFALHDSEVDFMQRAYAERRHRYFVLEREGRIVGGGGVAPLKGGDKSTCELRKMYLLPEARGLGLGEAILRACLDAAKEFGFTNCYLETTSKMVQAQALYQKLGFKSLMRPRGATGHGGCDRWYELDLRSYATASSLAAGGFK